MNELIKELADQAGRTMYHCSHNMLIFGDENIEKFAELLIKECAETIKKDMELAHIQLVPIDFKMYANGRLQRTIKEHFGVEE